MAGQWLPWLREIAIRQQDNGRPPQRQVPTSPALDMGLRLVHGRSWRAEATPLFVHPEGFRLLYPTIGIGRMNISRIWISKLVPLGPVRPQFVSLELEMQEDRMCCIPAMATVYNARIYHCLASSYHIGLLPWLLCGGVSRRAREYAANSKM